MRSLSIIIAGLLAALSVDPAHASCTALLRGGVFDYESLSTDDARVESFITWARDRRGQKSSDGAGGGVGVNVIDVVEINAQGNSAKAAEFWQDVENYQTSDVAQRSRLLRHANTASKVLATAFNDCLKIHGLHVWVETTARPEVFRVAAVYRSPGDPLEATINKMHVHPPLTKCTSDITDGTKIGGATTRAVCTRTTCQAVTVTVNAKTDPMGGGTLEIPAGPGCYPAPPVPLVKMSDQVNSGKQFTVTFDHLLSNIGSLYPNRALVGTFNQGDKEWRASGPNGPDGKFVEATYGCSHRVPVGARDSVCYSPLNYQLNIWGAVFTFNEAGDVLFNGATVGRIVVSK